jgi:hypothetical protein
MRAAVTEYRHEQYRRLIYPCIFFSIASIFNTLFQILVMKTGHPLHMIHNVLTTLIFLIILLQIKTGRVQDSKYMIVLFNLSNVLATVLVYQDLLPDALCGPKEIFSYQILFNFVYIYLLPLHEFHFGLVYFVPVVLIGVYF